ncbi:MAG: hypothetical protein E6K70_17715 [Planctomycetota bacterium]|nr:MAG: hypothetical protein E6K70_17715 [Planctomycetota bacterium]
MAVALVKGPETKRSPRKMPDSALEGTRLCDSGTGKKPSKSYRGPLEGNLGMKLSDRANNVAALPLNSQAAKACFYAGGSYMTPEAIEEQVKAAKLAQAVPKETIKPGGSEQVKLRRWLVSFGSAQEWYPVGEFVAIDADSAISRAIEVFGAATRHQAEEIPWDAAPLPKLTCR